MEGKKEGKGARKERKEKSKARQRKERTKILWEPFSPL